MSTRLASCSCGQLTATVMGEPIRVSVCHCLNCQRRSGSAFAEQAQFPRASVTVSGDSSTFDLVGDEGTQCTFHFCPTCGATVYYEPAYTDAWVAIPVGAFADPGFPAPTVSVYESRKHAWVVPPPAAKHIP